MGAQIEPNLTEAIPAGQADAVRTSGTSPRAVARLAWSLWALCAALVASSLLFDFLTPDVLIPPERPAPVLLVSSDLLSLVCPAIGVLIISRFPRNTVAWIFCGIGLLYGLRLLAMAYADYALLAQPWLPGGEHAAWISTWLRFSGLIPLGIFLVLLFPTGRLPSPRWRIVAWAAIGGAMLVAFGDALRFGPLPTYYYVYNPFGISAASRLSEASSVIGGALLSASSLASLISLILRWRRARRDERRQLRWFAYAAIPALAGSVVILLDWTVERFALLFLDQRTVWPVLQVAEKLGLFARDGGTPGRLVELRLDATLESLTVFALLVVPIFTVVAIVRYRLYDSDTPADDAMSRLTTVASTLRWRRILPAGAVVGFLPFVFIYLAIYAFVIFYPVFGQGDVVDQEQLDEVAAFVSGWGVRVFFLATTLLVASWVARRVGEKATLHGMLVGLVAVITNQVIMSFFDLLITLDELPIYLALGVAGGYLGGLGGRTNLAGEVYRASRRIGRAEDPAAIATAIGEHLGGPGTHGVALWQATSENKSGATAGNKPAQKFVLWGSWTSGGEGDWPSGTRLSEAQIPAVARLEERPSVLVRSAGLPAGERAAWERRGIRSALLLPLYAPGETWTGLLVATFRKRRRLSRSVVRAYLTLGTQAALALENLRLVEEARRAGVLVERQRLAREIHDTLAQGFTSIIMSLTAAEMAQHPFTAGAVPARHLEEARRTARESLAEARRLVWALRPEALDRHSLPEALERLAGEWSGETGVRARATTTGAPRPLLPEVEVALLRTAQEALTNIRKHARAAKVNITLSYMNDRVALDVLDDGVGFDPARLKSSVEAHDAGGFGLMAMHERVEQLGGALRIESAPGEGTTLAVELPVAANELKTPKTEALKEDR